MGSLALQAACGLGVHCTFVPGIPDIEIKRCRKTADRPYCVCHGSAGESRVRTPERMRQNFIALGRNRTGMNKTESAHAMELEMRKRAGEIQDYRWQPLRFKLAPDTTYEPDFLVLLADGAIEFHEIKGGFTTDDAYVKVKVVAQMFPYFVFRLFEYNRKGLKVRELKPL